MGPARYLAAVHRRLPTRRQQASSVGGPRRYHLRGSANGAIALTKFLRACGAVERVVPQPRHRRGPLPWHFIGTRPDRTARSRYRHRGYSAQHIDAGNSQTGKCRWARHAPYRPPLWRCRSRAHRCGIGRDEDVARRRLVELSERVVRRRRRRQRQASGSEDSICGSERCDQVVDLHAFAEIRIHEPRLHQPVAADHEGRWYRKHPAVIAMKVFHVLIRQKPLYLGSEPNGEIQRKCIAIVEIGQNREWCVGIGFELLCELLHLGHDRDNLTAQRLDPVQSLNHRPDVQSAIRAPMPAIKHHRDRPVFQKGFQIDQPPGHIRKDEGRHHFARPWRVFSTAVFVDPRHQPVNRFTIGWKYLSPCRGISVQPFVQRPLHVAALLEGQFETLGIGRRKRRHVLLRRIGSSDSLTETCGGITRQRNWISRTMYYFSCAGRPQGAVGLNSQGTWENAEVAIAASAAAAMRVLDNVVIGNSSELTRTPANSALPPSEAELPKVRNTVVPSV